MRKKIIWLVGSSIMVLAMLAAACAPAAEEAAPREVTPVPAPAEKGRPAATEEAKPAAKETTAATAGKDMVEVSWENLEGTTVTKEIENPQYGGEARFFRPSGVLAWDEAIQAPWTTGAELALTNEELIQGAWPRGAVTGEVSWITGGWMREDFSYGALAESWEFPDDTTAIFHIRKGIHWHNKPPTNGREYNAHDAVYNIKRIYFDIKTSTMYGMAGVSRPVDVYAEDDWTVVLKTPPGQLGKCWEFVSDWTRHFPKEVIDKYGDHNDWENVTGTGGFVLVDFVPMSSVVWERNPNYWMEDPVIPGNQLPYVDGLTELIIPDRSTQLAALRTAKVDWSYSYGFPTEDGEQLINTAPDLETLIYPESSFRNLGFRQDKPDLPFYDVNVRRALLMAVNQQEIIDTYYGGQGQIAPQIVMNLEMFKDVWTPIDELPPAPDGFDNRKMFEYHPDEAKQMLADAGYPNGFTFEVVMRDTGYYVDHMSMAKAYWEKIGVELEMDVKEYGTFMSIYQKKSHKDSLLCGRWGGEPYSAFCVRTGNMYNWAMINEPTFDDFYDQMTDLYFKPRERDAVMKKFNLAIIDNAPYYMLPQGVNYMFWQPWIKNYDGGFQLGLANYYYQKYLWIDQDLKESMGY